MSALDADTCHSDIAFAIKTKLNDEFSKTGVLIDTFSIVSSVNENDLSRIKDIEWNYLEKLKEPLNKKPNTWPTEAPKRYIDTLCATYHFQS